MPDLRWLGVVHSQHRSLVPGIASGSSMNLWSREWSATPCHSTYQRCLIQCLDVSGGVLRTSWWACPTKARWDFCRARWRGLQTVLRKKWSESHSALRASARTFTSRHSTVRAMPERIGRWLTGVANRDPEIVHRELSSTISSFFVCGLLHQTSAQLGGGEDQILGGDADGLRGSGEAVYQGDSGCCFN